MATGVKAAPQLSRLAAQFEAGEHKSRRQSGIDLTYISIDATIKRLNDVLGSDWSTDATTQVTVLENTVPGDDDEPDTLVRQYLAVTELSLAAVIDGAPRKCYGIGAMVNKDPDMAAKTALAEAIKKAGHQLGIGLYLWDPTARDDVQRKMKLATASVAQLKQEMYALAREQLGKNKPTAKECGALFGVAPDDLSDKAVLLGILEGQAS